MSLGSLARVGSPFRELPSLEPERGPSLEPETGPSLEPERGLSLEPADYGSLENVGNPFRPLFLSLGEYSWSVSTTRSQSDKIHRIAMNHIFGVDFSRE